MKHLPLRELAGAIVFVVAILFLYGGAYLACMERIELFTSIMDDQAPLATYRCGGEWAEAFFGPAHEFDRRIRPDLWNGEANAIDLRRMNDMDFSTAHRTPP